MKIEKENILKAFMIFENSYLEFRKRIEDKEETKKMINTWYEIFESIDFDYEFANKDFLIAVKRVIANSKYIPTIAEISNEMKKIYAERKVKDKEEKLWDVLEIENKCNLKSLDIQNSINLYYELNKKYSKEQIILAIKKYQETENIEKDMFLNTEDTLEKVMEDLSE